MQNKINFSRFLVPGFVLLSIFILSGAIFYTGFIIKKYYKPPTLQVGSLGSVIAENVLPVTGSDHIRGNPASPVIIIEFADPECPFCKRLHPSLKKIFEVYDGRVAWVYRHSPLDNLHSKARQEAEAFECAGELGGNEAFWKYADHIFAETPSNDQLDLARLPEIAGIIGLDKKKFGECLESGKFAGHIEADFQDAVRSGGGGMTPYLVIIAPNNKKIGVTGAQPYEVIKQFVEVLLPE